MINVEIKREEDVALLILSFAQEACVLWCIIGFGGTLPSMYGDNNKKIATFADKHISTMYCDSQPQFFLVRKYHRTVKVRDETTGVCFRQI